MIANCKDCRFWERRTVDSTSTGWCRQLSDVKIDIGVALIRGEYDGIGEKVFTPEDFGCTEFKAGCATCRGVPLTSVVYDLARGGAMYGCAEHPVEMSRG